VTAVLSQFFERLSKIQEERRLWLASIAGCVPAAAFRLQDERSICLSHVEEHYITALNANATIA
jgi:hypothetical protein